MSGDKGPFCGAKHYWSRGQTTQWECNTLITETGLSPTRGMECLKSENSTLRTALTEATEGNQELTEENTHILNKIIALQNSLADVTRERDEAVELCKEMGKVMGGE